MAIKAETEKQLEEIYQKRLDYLMPFKEEDWPTLYDVCKNCTNYMGTEHDFANCRQEQCFKNWLALQYLEAINN